MHGKELNWDSGGGGSDDVDGDGGGGGDGNDNFIIFRDKINGAFAICLKVNIALENLQLLNAGCFGNCAEGD